MDKFGGRSQDFADMPDSDSWVEGRNDPDHPFNRDESCDSCDAQEEGGHYCLLHSKQIKNMDLYCCADWAGAPFNRDVERLNKWSVVVDFSKARLWTEKTGWVIIDGEYTHCNPCGGLNWYCKECMG